MTLGTVEQVKLEAGTRVRILDTADDVNLRGKEGVVTENIGPYPSGFAALAEAIGVKVHEADAIFVDLDGEKVSLFADEAEVIADA